MNELINSHVKSEFKRFFEYAFKFNPNYWQELSGWEVLGKLRTLAEEIVKFNKLLTSVIQSEVHLKRIISDSSLDSAKELNYYAYLFLKDMSKADGLQAPKLPDAPAQFAGIYDSPSKLSNFIKNPANTADMRQQALARLKELVPWNKLPDRVFDREIFNSKKWEELKGEAYNKVDLSAINRDWLARSAYEASGGRWEYVDLFIKGWIWANRGLADVNGHMAHDINRLVPSRLPYPPEPKDSYEDVRREYGYADKEGWEFAFNGQSIEALEQYSRTLISGSYEGKYQDIYKLNGGKYLEFIARKRRERAAYNNQVNAINAARSAKIQQLVGDINNHVNQLWAIYRKQQDEEFPALLSEYEKSIEVASFPSSELSIEENFTGDKNFLFIKEKVGEELIKQIWNDPVKLTELLLDETKPEASFPDVKKILLHRLLNISIVTLKEWREIRETLIDAAKIGIKMPLGHESTEGVDILSMLKILEDYYEIEILAGLKQAVDQEKAKINEDKKSEL
ncbi:hypothetical protein GAMM_130008 [Gammaproteobacteria bacterium]